MSTNEEYPESSSKKTKKLMLVDDSSIIKERLSSLIYDLNGIEIVSEAKDANDAIRQFKQNRPDVVILDLRMPGGGGIKVLQEIKKEAPNTIKIVLTNYPYAAYRKRCNELGADYFVDKSTEFERIKSILLSFIE